VVSKEKISRPQHTTVITGHKHCSDSHSIHCYGDSTVVTCMLYSDSTVVTSILTSAHPSLLNREHNLQSISERKHNL
jgi:hypothetical protein